ncbi:hypothetical protein QOZ80_3AG0229970 [Eleusine coracana subsp. coracana]|nr:hypothetical protein QOZ80_3AG0229970 [Eleusine coracana subsp. coracana]
MPPPRPSSRRRRIAGEPPPGLFPAGDDLLRLIFVLSIAAAVATLCSLLNRRPQSFCDSSQSLDATDYDDAYDSCEPCPHNGRCVDGELECIQGFKRYGRKCVEDGVLSQTANKISELLQRRICVQHARAICGKPAKILFQMHDISNMVDELLSKNSAALTDDGIKLVKVRVLESLQGLLDTSLTFDKVEAFKCPELVAEFHVPLACQIRQWIIRSIISVTTFFILVCL